MTFTLDPSDINRRLPCEHISSASTEYLNEISHQSNGLLRGIHHEFVRNMIHFSGASRTPPEFVKTRINQCAVLRREGCAPLWIRDGAWRVNSKHRHICGSCQHCMTSTRTSVIVLGGQPIAALFWLRPVNLYCILQKYARISMT
jgi:hypothetical protein